MAERKFKSIGIAGAGAMGAGIAQVASMAGNEVIVYDIGDKILEKAEQQLGASLSKLAEKGKINQEEKSQTLSRIKWRSDLKEFASCDLIIEAIVEKAEIKKELFAKLSNLVSVRTIIATNTSSLSIASLAASCKHPENFLGIHFFNPAQVMPLVE